MYELHVRYERSDRMDLDVEAMTVEAVALETVAVEGIVVAAGVVPPTRAAELDSGDQILASHLPIPPSELKLHGQVKHENLENRRGHAGSIL